MPAPQIILDLVDRFERNLEAYTSGTQIHSSGLPTAAAELKR